MMIKIKRPVVIAEIGCNHMGDIDIAHKMIQVLGIMRLFGDEFAIDVIKLRKRSLKSY